ncbi:hypothetical protein IQ266_11255 [filamentous cyanobacterium LEGE 11480]|uniref:Uncharacterized protein n=1 Tax=Romeriopsis navalis LEGE 11480 TaxID=2777977 RepID=A0A928VQL8_9CYAN|nr:hypothetical protein [Romeriopsis navalis]MBE9030309.1 hypothetical protein [Romeriopsis navalis LEGE 11480]
MPAPKSSPLSDQFPVDAQLLMLMPRAGATLRHPHIQSPVLRVDPDGYYLEQRLPAASDEPSEIGLTRRILLDRLSPPEQAALNTAFNAIALDDCRRSGITKGLTNVQDRRWERLFTSIMTFLNPRQMTIMLYLYRLAAQQQSSTIQLKSNELLQDLGYTRTPDGGFASKLRSQLHRDLVTLHRTELVYAALKTKTAKAKIKTILRIKDFQIANSPRQFDLFHAADYTYELADSYSISLGFTDSLKRNATDALYFPNRLDVRQPIGSNAKNDYKTRLLIYLASRLKWDQPSDGSYLILAKQTVFRNIDLCGSNGSRNNQIFWRTVEALKSNGYLYSAQELPGKKKTNSIQFQINSEQLQSR